MATGIDSLRMGLGRVIEGEQAEDILADALAVPDASGRAEVIDDAIRRWVKATLFDLEATRRERDDLRTEVAALRRGRDGIFD